MRSRGGKTGHTLAGDNLDADPDTDRVAIQVWGDRYIDDAAIRGVSTDLTDAPAPAATRSTCFRGLPIPAVSRRRQNASDLIDGQRQRLWRDAGS